MDLLEITAFWRHMVHLVPCQQLITIITIIIIVETGSHYVSLAVLELTIWTRLA